jgi:hypothetical protein
MIQPEGLQADLLKCSRETRKWILHLSTEVERLAEEIEGERLWIKEGKKLHDVQKEEIERLREEVAKHTAENARILRIVELIENLTKDPAFRSDAMDWVAEDCWRIRTHECEKCGGSGMARFNMAFCDKCGGKGRI